MKAMILAAGRGSRMRELTDKLPKPLLKIGGRSLIEWQIIRLRERGFDEIVINVGYLGEQIMTALGDGSRYQVTIQYSIEPQRGLETGGGVFQALQYLGDKPFVLTNADVFSDFPYDSLKQYANVGGVQLVLVDNPGFKQSGDFAIQDNRLIRGDALTYAGISVINPTIFQGCTAGFFSIVPLFYQAIANRQAGALHYAGLWEDVGTPERLKHLQQRHGNNYD